MKVIGAICSIFAIVVTGSFCGVYWGMWTEAQDYNDKIVESNVGSDSDMPYDKCGSQTGEDSAGLDTKWSVILAFNSILYLIFAISHLFILLSNLFKPLFYIGCCGICCMPAGVLACLITTGIFRFSDDGGKCADDGIGLFKEHGETIMAAFIAQCVLFCFYQCCATFSIQMALATGTGDTLAVKIAAVAGLSGH